MDEPSKIQSMAERCRIDTDRARSEREEDELEQVSKLMATMERKFNRLVIPNIQARSRAGRCNFAASIFGDDEIDDDGLRDWLSTLRTHNLLDTLAAMARALPYGFLVDVNYDQTMITFGW